MLFRSQRPGSVERKVQEETVVRFYQLLMDYGKESIDSLHVRDKQVLTNQLFRSKFQRELTNHIVAAGGQSP